MSVLSSFVSWLKNPFTTTKRSIRDMIVVWCVFYAGVIIISGIINFVLSKLGITSSPDILQDFILENDIWKVLLVVVVLGPLLEEIIFRLPQKYHIWNLSIGIGGILYILFSLLSKQQLSDYLHIDQDYNAVISIISILIIGIICRYLLLSRWEDKLSGFWSRWNRAIIFISTLLFGLIHISNFTDGLDKWYVLWLMVIPQFLLGYMLSYIRWSRGRITGRGVHSLHNFVSFLPIMLFASAMGDDTKLIFESSQKAVELISSYPQLGLYSMIVGVIFATIFGIAIYGMIEWVKSSGE